MKLLKVFNNKKRIYAYECSEGDKGIIIADSIDKATKLFKKEYPDRNIVSGDEDYYDNGAYLFEVDLLSKENKLYCPFPW